MLLRILLFFILAFLFFLLINLFLSWSKRERRVRSEEPLAKGEEMVLDPQCQSYLPKGEALLRGGNYFCSEECARLYLSSHS